ncbi:hypothetical protein SK128_024797, partial [Halocaridina rubra]
MTSTAEDLEILGNVSNHSKGEEILPCKESAHTTTEDSSSQRSNERQSESRDHSFIDLNTKSLSKNHESETVLVYELRTKSCEAGESVSDLEEQENKISLFSKGELPLIQETNSLTEENAVSSEQEIFNLCLEARSTEDENRDSGCIQDFKVSSVMGDSNNYLTDPYEVETHNPEESIREKVKASCSCHKDDFSKKANQKLSGRKKWHEEKLTVAATSKSPENYMTTSLGRQVRKGRRPWKNITSQKEDRGGRSKTEPPPELAPPDLLQVSWVWETRSPARAASVRRRPSRKVSCRRRYKPRLTPRRASGSVSSGSPKRRFSPVNSSVLEEDGIQNSHFSQGQSDLEYPPHLPDVLTLTRRSSSPKFLPYCDIPPSTIPEPRMRSKSAANYLHSASRALRQKWRNSEILIPKFIHEALDNMKHKEDEISKRKEFIERAKTFPIQLRKLTYILFRQGKHSETSDFYVNKPSGSGGGVCFDEHSSLASLFVKRRKSVHRHNSVSIKRQNSFSPTNSFKRNYDVNWSQKYQNAMMAGRGKSKSDVGRVKEGEGIRPTIQITKPDDDNDDEAFVSEDDNVSTAGSSLSHLQIHQEKRNSVLDRLFKHIMPRSLSINRSFPS